MSARLCKTLSLCAPASLLQALQSRNVDAFKEGLRTCDPNVWLGHPHYATHLDLACQESDTGDFVRELLAAGANPNLVNAVRKRSPVHFAAEAYNLEALQLLLDDPRTDVNAVDSFGNTALHSLAKQQPQPSKDSVRIQSCIRLLLDRSDLQVNKTNRKGQTAIYLAAVQGDKDIVNTMLDSGRVDLDVAKAYDGRTARDMILRNIPDLRETLPEIGITDGGDDDIMALFRSLFKRKCEAFVMLLDDLKIGEENKSLLDSHDGNWTFLQYASYNGLTDVVRVLLRRGADPNATAPNRKRLPSLLAAAGGCYDILELFMSEKHAEFSSPDDGETALHIVVTESKWHCYHDNYKACFDLLLQNPGKVDINAIDHKRDTALHIASRYGDEYFMSQLLDHGAYIGNKNLFDEPPLVNMPSQVLQNFLDNCLTTNGEFPRDDKYEVIFDYKFLAPPTSVSIPDTRDATVLPILEESDTSIPETEPLLYISKSQDLRHLLKHPVITSFLALKWRGIRPFFYINLAFYLIFVALITSYILFVYEYAPSSSLNPLNTSSGSNDRVNVPHYLGFHSENASFKSNLLEHNVSRNNSPAESCGKCIAGDVVWGLLVFFFVFLALRELFQVIMGPKSYICSPENYLELLLIVFTALVLFCQSAGVHTRPHLSAITILLSWAELVLLIGRHPRLSTNIEMLKTVSQNFLQFLAWYSILIVAFALSFYTLFRSSTEDDNFFLDPGTSFFKTVVMVTGEFDAADIPFVLFPGTSHVVFVLFVFLVAIVLFNLLNGLAVSDTQAIKDDAELVGIVSRIKLISYTESMLLGHPFWCRRKAEADCCCCVALSNIRALSFTNFPVLMRRVRLFPEMLRYRMIRVLPNQDSQILNIPSDEKKSIPDNNTYCHESFHCCRDFTLDSHILRDASDILSTKGQHSELQQIKDQLESTQNQLEYYRQAMQENSRKVQEFDQRFESIEKSCQETQVAVRHILDILQKGMVHLSHKA